MTKINNSIAFFLLIVAFGLGYWLVCWIYSKFKMPKFDYDTNSSGSKNNQYQNEEHSQENTNNNDDSKRYQQNQQSEKDNKNSLSYYCELLNLNGNTSVENIKAKYRETLTKYHPDKVNHLGHEFQTIAEQKTREINKAYDYLKKVYNFN